MLDTDAVEVLRLLKVHRATLAQLLAENAVKLPKEGFTTVTDTGTLVVVVVLEDKLVDTHTTVV
jgi:hypothetical protein